MEGKSSGALLFNFAAPAIAGLLANALYNIADRIFVGQTVGAPGLAALALSFPFMLLFIAAGLLVGVGTSSRVSILLGEKNASEAAHTIGTGIVMGLVLGLANIPLWLPLMRPLLSFTGADDAVYPSAAAYFGIIIYGAPFLVMSFSSSYVLRAIGHPRLSMGSQFLGAALNILLDYIFVWKMGQGVRGAAFATVISQIASCIFAVTMLLRYSPSLRKHHFYPSLNLIKTIAKVGMPPAIMETGFTIIMAMMNRQVQKYGGDLAVSAMGIFLGLDALMFLPAIGITEGAQPIIGYNFGAKNIKRVKEITWLTVKAALAYFVISTIIVEVFPEHLVRMFNSDDEKLIEVAVYGLRMTYWGMPFAAMTLTAGSFFYAIGRARESMILAVCRFTIFIMAPLMLLPPLIGITGVWLTFPVSDMLGGLFGFYMVRKALKGME